MRAPIQWTQSRILHIQGFPVMRTKALLCTIENNHVEHILSQEWEAPLWLLGLWSFESHLIAQIQRCALEELHIENKALNILKTAFPRSCFQFIESLAIHTLIWIHKICTRSPLCIFRTDNWIQANVQFVFLALNFVEYLFSRWANSLVLWACY